MIRRSPFVGCAVLALVVLAAPAVAGGRKPFRLKQDQLFESGFHGFEPPDREQVMAAHLVRRFDNLNEGQLWDGALRLLMQHAVIVKASRRDGVIACMLPLPSISGEATDTMPRTFLKEGFPTIVYVRAFQETGAEVSVDWIEGFLKRLDQPERSAIGMSHEHKQILSRRFFEALELEAGAAARWSRFTEQRESASARKEGDHEKVGP